MKIESKGPADNPEDFEIREKLYKSIYLGVNMLKTSFNGKSSIYPRPPKRSYLTEEEKEKKTDLDNFNNYIININKNQ